MIDTTTDNADLAAIKKREERACPGPWRAELEDRGGPAIVTRDGARWEGDIPYPVWTCDDPEDGCMDEAAQWSRDATFIAHARADIPALVAKVEALRAVLAPLLEQPWISVVDEPYWHHSTHEECIFCKEHSVHAPDCPWARKAELLGR